MTVSVKESSAETVSAKILEIRRKITDNSYVDNAVQRIASVLSRQITAQPCRSKEAIYG